MSGKGFHSEDTDAKIGPINLEGIGDFNEKS
jgi:hypothetical protein